MDFSEFVVKRGWCRQLKPRLIHPLVWLRPTWFLRTPSFRGETSLDGCRSLAVNMFCCSEHPGA